ncbi:MAG TPA: hypothetical protein ENI95_05840 [Chloroflexi bacterium]|nr:hypothetical protein [Chloroflexota bacterium]
MMNEDTFTDLGIVSNLSVVEDRANPGTLFLSLSDTRSQRTTLSLTQGAAQVLWFYLTQLLFPRAAAQLTPRVTTATLQPAPNLQVVFAVKVWMEKKSGLIEVIGVSAVEGWRFRFTPEEGHELWASLEEVLHIIGGGGA